MVCYDQFYNMIGTYSVTCCKLYVYFPVEVKDHKMYYFKVGILPKNRLCKTSSDKHYVSSMRLAGDLLDSNRII